MNKLAFIIGIVTAILYAPISMAALPPAPVCSFPGCSAAPANLIVKSALPTIATIFLNSAAALSVIFVIVGGTRLLLSLGRDEEFEKGRKTIIWALGGVVLAIMSHRIVSIILTETYVSGGDPIFDIFTSIIRIMSMLLNVTFLITIIINGARMVIARGKEEDVTKGRKGILYSIAGIVIINVAPFVVKAIIDL
jgi:hypothetical protein